MLVKFAFNIMHQILLKYLVYCLNIGLPYEWRNYLHKFNEDGNEMTKSIIQERPLPELPIRT